LQKNAQNEQGTMKSRSGDATKDVETPKHTFKNISEARSWAKENIVGTYKNADTNTNISVSKTAIDKYLSEKAVGKSVNVDAHLSALTNLPELIKTSVVSERHQDRDKKPDIKEIIRLRGSINYENGIYPVKITVKAIKNEGNKAYSYEVMEIESPTAKELSGNQFQKAPENRSQLTNNPDISLTDSDLHSSKNRLSVADNGTTESYDKGTKNS
jgi:hypothetical protein